ncbi:MAG: hypothetical protein WBQ23_05120 [Bacteroidota bacterium]
MEVILAGTGETTDLPIIIFGIALFFFVIYLAVRFAGWLQRRIREAKEEEFLRKLEEGYPDVRDSGDSEVYNDPPC